MAKDQDHERCVLVIDDTESIHEDFRAILTRAEGDTTALEEAEAAIFGASLDPADHVRQACYQVESAFQGQEGLEKIREALDQGRPFQLAFVDMRMPPGWDGLQTIEEIWKVDPLVQIVICTAHSDYSWRQIVQRLGYSDQLLILKKPFDTAEVEQLAGALTEKWHLARQAATKMSDLTEIAAARTQAFEAANILLKKEVAERSRTEEQLRISEANLARAQEVAHVGSWYLSIQDNTLTWSDETYNIFHVPEGTPWSYEDFWKTVHPDDRSVVAEAWSVALQGTSYDVEHRIVIDGNVQWIRVKAEVDLDQAGQAIRAVGTVQDITKRKETEQALRDSEQKFRSFVENASDIIFCLSPHCEFTYVSPNWTGLLGHALSEVLDQPISRFLPPGEEEKCTQALNQVIATGRKEKGIECQLKHKDGTWHWHTISLSPLKTSTGDVTSVVGIAHDITRRKHGQEELQRAQQELRQILSASTPLCAISNDYDFLMFNDTFCMLFGVHVDTIKDKKCHDVLCSSACHTGECPVNRIANDGEQYQYEVTIGEGTDDEIVCMATATPYFNADYSGTVGVVVSFMDITERKKAEKDIAEANRKLEQANRELKEMQSQVIQTEKLASIGQLAAGVAHEMNTPVGFVASNFSTLQSYMNKFLKLFAQYEELAELVEHGDRDTRLDKIGAISESRQKMKIDYVIDDLEELFKDSKEGLARVTDIIQNLRDFSRIDQSEACAEYDLNEGIRTTLVVARNEIKYDANIELDLSDVPTVVCHSGQVNQVFLNILVNAAQAIKGMERDEKGLIRIRTHATETHVVCEIKDNGPGISESVVSKVFDPFFTTKPPGKGTGLGLSVSYDIIVNKHNGKLSVDSSIGEGTTFTVELLRSGADEGVGKDASNEAQNCAVCR